METLRIQHDGDSAEFSLFGGQLLRWQAGGRERLFLSPRAVFDGRAAIRGGVPVIFPQFNARGPFARHGFARTQGWQLREHQADRLLLELTDPEATRAQWPHRFALRLRATIERDALTLALEVESLDARAFEFSCALHSYFACALGQTRVRGLADCGFEEDGDWHPPSGQAALFPAPPLDRIYRGAAVTPPAECSPANPIDAALSLNPSSPRGRGPSASMTETDLPWAPAFAGATRDAGSQTLWLECGDRTLAIESAGFADWVVWNPGRDGAAALTDLGADCSESFLCIEPGRIFEPIRLESGERWTGALRMRVADALGAIERSQSTTTGTAMAGSKPQHRSA